MRPLLPALLAAALATTGPGLPAAQAGTWLVSGAGGDAQLYESLREIPQALRAQALCLAGCDERLLQPSRATTASQLRLVRDSIGEAAVPLRIGGSRINATLAPLTDTNILPLTVARRLDRSARPGAVLEFLDMAFGRSTLRSVRFVVSQDATRVMLGAETLRELQARLVLREGVLALGTPAAPGGPRAGSNGGGTEGEWRSAFAAARQRVSDAEEEVAFLRRFTDRTMASGAQQELRAARQQLGELELEALERGIPRSWWR